MKKKPRKKGVKKKIKKSDSVIVVAKTPIEQIIGQTAVAKEIKDAVKKLSKKEQTLDKKVEQIKPKKPEKPVFKDFYGRSQETGVTPYNPKVFYKTGYNVKDNSELFQWSEYRESVAKRQKITERDELGNREIMIEQDLMQYLNNFILNQFIDQDMNAIPIEQRERMNYYTMFNQPWVMMKVTLLGYGEKRYHAALPKPAGAVKEQENEQQKEKPKEE